MNFKALAYTIISAALVVLAGCTTYAPPYGISISNVQQLKNSDAASVSVGDFVAQPSVNNESISVRANPVSSPKETFSKYLQDAISQELLAAQRLDAKSDIQITGVLMKNDISAAGFITNSAIIAARFTVRRGNKVAFDKVKEATIQWDSNFSALLPSRVQFRTIRMLPQRC